MLWDSWLAMTLQAARLGLETQQAMARRLMGLDISTSEPSPESPGPESAGPESLGEVPTPPASAADAPKIASEDGKTRQPVKKKMKSQKKAARASRPRRSKKSK
jgi:hypothetical protein